MSSTEEQLVIVVSGRSFCALHQHVLPDRFPVHPRNELAQRRPVVVATRGEEKLLCAGGHDGPHIWPDGDVAGEPGGGVAVPTAADSRLE